MRLWLTSKISACLSLAVAPWLLPFTPPPSSSVQFSFPCLPLLPVQAQDSFLINQWYLQHTEENPTLGEYVCVCVCVHMCCMWVCVYLSVYVNVCVWVRVLYVSVCMWVCVCYMWVCLWVCMWMCVWVCVCCMWVCVCECLKPLRFCLGNNENNRFGRFLLHFLVHIHFHGT